MNEWVLSTLINMLCCISLYVLAWIACHETRTFHSDLCTYAVERKMGMSTQLIGAIIPLLRSARYVADDLLFPSLVLRRF